MSFRKLIACVLLFGVNGSLQADSLVTPPMFFFNEDDQDGLTGLCCLVSNVGNSDTSILMKIINRGAEVVDSKVEVIEPGRIVTFCSDDVTFGERREAYCRIDVIKGSATFLNAASCESLGFPSKCTNYLEAHRVPSPRGRAQI